MAIHTHTHTQREKEMWKASVGKTRFQNVKGGGKTPQQSGITRVTKCR